MSNPESVTDSVSLEYEFDLDYGSVSLDESHVMSVILGLELELACLSLARNSNVISHSHYGSRLSLVRNQYNQALSELIVKMTSSKDSGNE